MEILFEIPKSLHLEKVFENAVCKMSTILFRTPCINFNSTRVGKKVASAATDTSWRLMPTHVKNIGFPSQRASNVDSCSIYDAIMGKGIKTGSGGVCCPSARGRVWNRKSNPKDVSPRDLTYCSHWGNKPRQIGLNHDYNMPFSISPCEC